MTNPSVDPLVGRTVAHYEILSKLGGGGMGVVYKARDTRLGRVVALKFLPQQWSHDEDAKQRFVREAQAASATEHRNICTIHDIATADDGQLFIVMAYYEGATLKQRLEAGALPIDDALDIATQLAEGLARAHAQGVVHRDIKPGNVILADDGVRILDFGLATFADALQLTIVGSTLGTAAYMSPEQVRGEAVDARTDVWAVGVILYQMLTGHVPFRGTYAEAIAHAIRNEAPGSVRAERPEVPEELEQLVFRALHKEANIRFASGRELARALRQARGQTVPMDLRTEPVQVPQQLLTALPPRRRWRRALVAAAVIVVAGLAGVAWALAPGERAPVVILPVLDLTGSGDLGPYRRALAQTIVLGLADSPSVRPVSWGRMLQTLRGFEARKTDISGREVAQALAGAEGARLVILPTLLSEDEQWRVRIEVRDGATATRVASYESAPLLAAALTKDTAFQITVDAMTQIEAHFRRGLRAWLPVAEPLLHVRTLDAARAFETGVDMYEEQEYAAAYSAFQEAVTLDPRSPLAHAWSSRVLAVARRDDEAAAAAAQAMRLLSEGVRVSAVNRLFIEAIDAEARGELALAAERHQELVEDHPGDPLWLTELAAFQDRHADTREEWEAAVLTYHQALEADPSVIRPHLELCRLYNRLQDPERARQEGETALASFEKAGWQGGQALARFCLVDRFRSGNAAERAQAQQHAETALRVLRELRFAYNLPRALYYLGMAAGEQRRLSDARELLEEADRTVQQTGNRVMQPLVAGALSVVYSWLGDGPRAAEGFARTSTGYERLGDERRAARQLFNAAAIRVQFGEGTSKAVAEVERLLEVFEQRGDFEFGAVARELFGDAKRLAASYDQAETELLKALQLAEANDLFGRVSLIRTAQARLWFERGHYEKARARLVEIVEREAANANGEALMLLGRVQGKLGDFDSARASLAAAGKALDATTDRQMASFLSLTRGEVAYEAGQFDEARRQFEQARALWTDTYTLGSALEARAYLGWLDGLAGRWDRARMELQISLARAQAMGRVAVEETCRLWLARVDLLARQPAGALQVLDGIPANRRDALGLELRAGIHAARSRALATTDPAAVAEEAAASRELLERIRADLPEAARALFFARREIREMAGS